MLPPLISYHAEQASNRFFFLPFFGKSDLQVSKSIKIRVSQKARTIWYTSTRKFHKCPDTSTAKAHQSTDPWRQDWVGKAQGPREIPYFARAQFSTSAVPCITTIFSKKASSKGCLEPPTLYSTIQSTHSSTIHHSTIPYIRGQCELKILSFTCNRTQLAPQPKLEREFHFPPRLAPITIFYTDTHTVLYCAIQYSTPRHQLRYSNFYPFQVLEHAHSTVPGPARSYETITCIPG